MSDAFPIAFGRYELIERLAVGGMAELFLARATGAHGFAKTLVIKRILPHLAADQQFTAMFIDEAKITARLAHPKIAQTYELGHEAGRLYIAMEFVDGLDVLAILRECAHRRVRIAPELSVYICKETLDALDFAHRLTDDAGKSLEIVHRDISPSNILVSRRGDVKLVDFGIAHALESEHNTKAGTLKGKYGYMSPEQVLGSGVSGRSDLFSVAVVLAEMLTGRRLFAAPNELDVLLMVRDVKLDRLARFGGHIEPGLLAILHRGLAKSPEERFPDAASFRDALDEWLFEHRHRVGPKSIADLVESLHADATARRVQQLAEKAAGEEAGAAPAPDAAPPAVAPGPAAAAPASRPPPPPRKATTPPPAIDAAIAAAPPIAPALPAAPRAASASSGPPPGPAVADAPRPRTPPPAPPPGSGYIDLGDLLGDAPPAPAASEPSPRRAATEAATPPARARRASAVQPPSGDPLRADSIPIEVEIPIEESDPGHSARFPDIGAAVASISAQRPRELDPAASDFDGSDISDLPGRAPRAAPPSRLPTLEEAARAPKPAPPPVAEITETPADAGDLAGQPMIKLLFQRAVAKSSGLLVVSVGEIKKEIYLADGLPEYVSSNLAGELFGNYLVAEGAVSSGELDMALAMLPHFGGKLGDTLVGLGLMKPLDVFRHLTRQVRAKLLDVCTWTKGNYTWYPGRKNPREAFPLDLDPFEVVGAGAMAADPDHLTGWAGVRSSLVYKANPRAKVAPEAFKIGKPGRDVLAAMDGRVSLGEAMRKAGREEERVAFLRAFYLFTLVEVIKPG